MRVLAHQEIGGGNAHGMFVIVDTCELEDGLFETMAMRKDGAELACRRSTDEMQAMRDFNEILMQFAEPMQKAVLSAGMKIGKKYTLYRYSEFGFPTEFQFTFEGEISCTTYAQYRDAVKFKIVPTRKRGERWYYMMRNTSFIIVEGWQKIPDDVKYVDVESSGESVLRASKYYGFDPRYFDDIRKVAKNVIADYDVSTVGKDGRIYA